MTADGNARLTRWVNVGLGVVVAALGAWLLLKVRADLDLRGASGEPGPGYFPAVITGCLVLLGIALLVAWLVGPRAREGTAPQLSLQPRHLLRAGLVWLVLVVCTALIEPLGFLIAGEVMVLAIIVLVERTRSVPVIVALLLLPPAMYGLFVVLLDVDLPGGALWV